jgi:hypothetical protein
MFDTVLCYSRVFDIENNISEIAVCTVFVLDTISPTILLTSHQNGDTISTLLDTVIVNIHDNSGIQHVQFIDSVTHTSNDMYRVDDTTFLQAISAPSGGTYTFTIDAVDRAGNSKTTLYSLYFNPSTSAPFSVAIPDQQTKEDTKFPKIALDNHVTFNASGLSADDIKWTITTKTGSHLQVAYDPTQRTVVITPEHNWYGSESVTFFATVYDTIPAVDYATFVVANVNDSPSITMPGVYCKKANAQFDTLLLDTCANDPDQDWLQWTFTAGDYFEVKYISTFIYLKDNTGIARPIKRRTNRVIIVEKADAAIPLPPDWKGTDTLGFSVSDGVYTAKKNILFRKADNCLFIPIIF